MFDPMFDAARSEAKVARTMRGRIGPTCYVTACRDPTIATAMRVPIVRQLR